MKRTPLPGHWLSLVGDATTLAMHPRRPWIAVGRHTPFGLGRVERHNFETGHTVDLLAQEDLRVDALGWVGDLVALYGRVGDRGASVVQLLDPNGNGVLAEERLSSWSPARFTPHPLGVDLVVPVPTPEAPSWESFALRLSNGEALIQRRPRILGVDAPLWHPDGGVAVVERHEGTASIVLSLGATPKRLDLPWKTSLGVPRFLGWSRPTTLIVACVRWDGSAIVSFWTIETDTHHAHRHWWDPHDIGGARAPLLSPDASALLFEDTTTRVLTLGDACHGPVPRPWSGVRGWLDSHTIFVERGACPSVAAWRSVRFYNIDRELVADHSFGHVNPGANITLAAIGQGRMLLAAGRRERRYFLSDPQLGRDRDARRL